MAQAAGRTGYPYGDGVLPSGMEALKIRRISPAEVQKG
jgi:hypothetical protein